MTYAAQWFWAGSCLHAYCPTDDPDTRGTVLCLDVGANYLATVRPSASCQSNLVPEQLCKGRYRWLSKPNLVVLKANLMAVFEHSYYLSG